MKNTILKKAARPLFFAWEVCLLTGITLFAVFPVSCKVTTSGIEIIGSDYTVPTLESYSVVSSEEMVLEFSEEVNLLAAVVSPFVLGVSNSSEHSVTEDLSPALKSASGIGETIPIKVSYSEDGKTVTVGFEESTKVGMMYEFYGEVENKIGSSLTFAVSFSGYNSRIPDLVLSEVQDGSTKIGGKEFIEFVALNDGNLAGLVIKSENDGDAAAFYFPEMEVKKGDYITVHYRPPTDDTSLCISETTGNKTLSKAVGSSDNAWDLWADNTDSRLGASQDVITLQNRNTGEVLLALVYNINKKSTWMKEKFQTAVENVVEIGLWEPSAEITDAFTFGTSPHIVRTNLSEIIEAYDNGEINYPFSSNASEWTRVPDSKVTPGY